MYIPDDRGLSVTLTMVRIPTCARGRHISDQLGFDAHTTSWVRRFEVSAYPPPLPCISANV